LNGCIKGDEIEEFTFTEEKEEIIINYVLGKKGKRWGWMGFRRKRGDMGRKK